MCHDIPQQHTPDAELRDRYRLEFPEPHNIWHLLSAFIADLITAGGSIKSHHIVKPPRPFYRFLRRHSLKNNKSA